MTDLLTRLQTQIHNTAERYSLDATSALLAIIRVFFHRQLPDGSPISPTIFAVHQPHLPTVDLPEEFAVLAPSVISEAYCTLMTSHKEQGAYYTPPSLIQQCWNRILVQPSNPQLVVCDPSCGSGLFLLWYLRQSTNPIHCAEHQIYGVDLDPTAVEICRWNLYLGTDGLANPQSIIDHIQWGNALLGSHTTCLPSVIPLSYYILDERSNRAQIRKARRQHRSKLESLPTSNLPLNKERADTLYSIALWDDATIPLPTQQEYHLASGTRTLSPTQQRFRTHLCQKHGLFHWALVFPEVFANGGFDVIIGNPPYVDSELHSRLHPKERSFLSQNYRTTQGNWDLFVPFVERSLSLLKPQGVLALVTPEKIISAEYCATLQQILLSKQWTELHCYSASDLFQGAQVTVAISVVRNQSSDRNSKLVYHSHTKEASTTRSAAVQLLKQLPPGFLTFPLRCRTMAHLSLLVRHKRIKDVANLTDSATTNEAYRIKSLVADGDASAAKDPKQILLVNTGTIDPFELLWGEKNCRYLGFSSKYPIISSKALKKHHPKRYTQATKQTVAVAGLSKRLEAAVLPNNVLSGKSTVLLTPHRSICPYALCALINSSLYQELYSALFGSRGFGHASMSIGPRQMEMLPIPDARELAQGSTLSVLGALMTQDRSKKTWQQINDLVPGLFQNA